MPKKIIAIDADDTLFDEINAIRLFMNENYGFQHTIADYSMPGEHMNYFQSIWGLDEEQTDAAYEAFVRSPAKENLKPLPHALEVLTFLKKRYELIIITARDNRGVGLTHKALAEHYPDIFDDVHFVSLWGDGKQTKAQIAKTVGAGYLIDDSADHCKLAAEAGVHALLFGNYGWTKQGTTGIQNVKDWLAVKDYFNGRA